MGSASGARFVWWRRGVSARGLPPNANDAGPVLTILLFYVAVNAVAIHVNDSYLAAGRTA